MCASQLPALQLPEDMRFQRAEWRVQRIGRLLMLAIVIAALAGVFGDGPLATRFHASGDGVLQVEYDRFVRVGASARLLVKTADGRRIQDIAVTFDDPAAIEVGSIETSPLLLTAGDGGAASDASTPQARAWTLHLEAQRSGIHRITIRGVTSPDSTSQGSTSPGATSTDVRITQFAWF